MDLYRAVAAGFRLGWRALALDVASSGHDHIPARGPALLASNHIGYLDFCFVALAPPRPRRQVRFLIRHDVFDHRVVGWALRRMDQVPIDVHGDPTRGLDRAAALLDAGEVVGIHPEGTISPSFVPRTGRTGTVRLAQRTGVPIVPVGLWGSQRLLTKWRPRQLTRGVAVEVVYGEPMQVTPDQDPVAATAKLMGRIADAVGDAQRRYPQRPDGDDWWVPAHLGGSAPTPEDAERRLAQQAAQRRRRAEVEGRRRSRTDGRQQPPGDPLGPLGGGDPGRDGTEGARRAS